MKYIADLHIHSYLSRATSKQLNLPHLNKWAQLKGIQLVSTGDFTHPKWFAELKEMLEPAEEGLFRLKSEFEGQPATEVYKACQGSVRFILSVEISNIYKRNGAVRKVHNVVFMPDFEAVQKFNTALERIGNIRSDGRPILGLDSRDLLELVLVTSPQGYLIPAHIWTPWFSVLGSKSGFDSIAECYDDLTEHIFALETGLSSDPAMNWRLSQLDRYALVSNSDAHSPANLGREANLFDTELAYPALFTALKSRASDDFGGTIEFFPQEGKYHLDGHRKCNCRMEPEETLANKGRCPVCGKKVTVGVLNRVVTLADRDVGIKPPGAAPFHSLVPLAEIIAEVQGFGPNSKNVQALYQKLLSKLGPEIPILMEIPLEDIGKCGHALLVEAIRRVRVGQVHIAGGYDGEYGTIKIFDPAERDEFLSQTLFTGHDFPLPKMADKSGKYANRTRSNKQSSPKTSTPATASNVLPETVTPVDALLQLNADQLAAVKHAVGPLLIVAGPGTGKTRTLTHRIAYLVREKGVSPTNILAITFTRHAAREMQERLEVLLEREITQQMTICTFHALGHLILQTEIEKLGRPPEFTIYTDQDRLEVLKNLSLNLTVAQMSRIGEKIASIKNKLVTAEKLAQQNELFYQNEFVEIYTQYEQALRRLNAVDYEDLILLPYLIFNQFPAVRRQYQQQFQWISVDEYQDINFAQYHFLRYLLGEAHNLCAIGDPNQAIYGFRGSDVHYFHQFQHDFPGATLINLGQNYRSTSMIINASTQVIAQNPQVEPVEIWSEIPGTTRIEIITAPTDKAEAEFVVHQIEKLAGGTGFFSLDSSRVSATDEENAPHAFSDFAVLYRLRAQSAALEEAFLRSGMPYQTMGETPFFEKKPIKAVLSYLKVIQNPNSNIDWLRVLNTPPRGLGEKAVQTLVDFCRDQHISIYEGIESQDLIPKISLNAHSAFRKVFTLIRELQYEAAKNTIAGIIRLLLDDVGLRAHFGPTKENEHLWTLLLNFAESYENRLQNFLRDICLLHETDSHDPRIERVSLMSLHASKGLEFPVVFIVGCEEGLLPYLRSDLSAKEQETAIQEERRLLYVGMTRAQQRLYLIHSRSRFLFGKRENGRPSRFLSAIETGLKQMRASFSDQKKKVKTDNQMDLKF